MEWWVIDILILNYSFSFMPFWTNVIVKYVQPLFSFIIRITRTEEENSRTKVPLICGAYIVITIFFQRLFVYDI